MVHSPLARAAETATIVWGGRKGSVTAAPSLREIDLHSLQGVLKNDALSHLGAFAHSAWKGAPAHFELDGRRPVVDLWERAAAAWGADVLPQRESVLAASPPPITRRLVVAHNAVNQALIGTALGLPPSSFRRVVQGNGCATEVLWSGGGGAASSSATATVTCLNVGSGGPPLTPAPAGGGLILLLAATGDGDAVRGASAWLAATRGAAAVVATPDALRGAVASVVAEAGVRGAVVVQARDVLPTAAAAASTGRGVIAVVVAPPAVVAAALAAAVGAGVSPAPPLFSLTPGGVSVIEVPPGDAAGRRTALRCANWMPGGVASVVQGVAGV